MKKFLTLLALILAPMAQGQIVQWSYLRNIPANVTAVGNLSTVGLTTMTVAGTFTGRTLVAPAAGFTITNGNGVSGNPTFVLSDDLAALEALSGTNTIYYRSGLNTWTGVNIGSGLDFTGGTLSATGGGGGGGGGGTVTTVSAGDLSPIFTSSVSNPTSIPGLTFSLNVQSAHVVLIGPTTGTAAPTFRALVNGDLPSVATATFKARQTAGTGASEDLTAAQAAALLPAFVGDSGSGGTKGLVPAPSTGDAAAGKYLGAGGSFIVIPDGAADASTKGIVTFNPSDFNSTLGNVSIDWANTQAATNAQPGKATAAQITLLESALQNSSIDTSAKLAAILGDETGTSGGFTRDTGATHTTPTFTNERFTVSAHGSMGSTETFDLANGNWHTGTLDANLTVTLTGWTNAKGCYFFLGLTQDATGGRTITWPAAVVNPPTLPRTANSTSWVTLWSSDNGTTIYASSPGAQTDVWTIAASDETTPITTGTAKATFRAPYAATVTAVRMSLTTASSSGLPTIDINEGGTTILSTKLTCDANEKTSTTAATAAVISDSLIADDAEITIDFDVAGTGATGVKVAIYVTR